MKRRGFIVVLAGAAAWPLAALAQQPERMRRVGVLRFSPKNDPFTQTIVTAFAQALERLGWFEGENIRIDYRFAAGDPPLFKTYAAELVALAPDAILASTTPAIVAVRGHTRTIQIIFVLAVDPVGRGWVHSLARPGGNLTGFISWDAPLMGKWLQLLKEAAPRVMRVAVIFNPDTAPFAPFLSRAIEDAAPSFGMTVTLAPVHDDAGIDGSHCSFPPRPLFSGNWTHGGTIPGDIESCRQAAMATQLALPGSSLRTPGCARSECRI